MKAAIGILNLKNKINQVNMIRTAEHLGFRRVFVIGDKLDISEKSCMNIHKHMIIKVFPTEEEFIKYIKKNNYKLVLIEKTEDSVNINSYNYPDNIVLMSGHENFGFSNYLLTNSDGKIHISNCGLVNCMNTSAAFAIGVYKYFEQKVLK